MYLIHTSNLQLRNLRVISGHAQKRMMGGIGAGRADDFLWIDAMSGQRGIVTASMKIHFRRQTVITSPWVRLWLWTTCIFEAHYQVINESLTEKAKVETKESDIVIDPVIIWEKISCLTSPATRAAMLRLLVTSPIARMRNNVKWDEHSPATYKDVRKKSRHVGGKCTSKEAALHPYNKRDGRERPKVAHTLEGTWSLVYKMLIKIWWREAYRHTRLSPRVREETGLGYECVTSRIFYTSGGPMFLTFLIHHIALSPLVNIVAQSHR